MKITITQILFIVSFIGFSYAHEIAGQELLEQKINLEVTNEDLRTTLNKIERVSNVRFIFNPKEVKINQKVSVKAKNEQLKTILNEIFTPLKISYELAGNYQILLFKKEVGFIELQPKEIKVEIKSLEERIKGNVKDEDGAVLAGVSVQVKGKNIGTLTDADGNFQLTVPNKQTTLVFSFIGYLNQEVVVGDKNTINVILKEDTQALDEVVVTGYSTSSRKDILGSITSIKDKDIEQTTPVNAFDAVQGRMAGVQITSNGGPGAGSDIRIRGTSTFNAGVNPLYVVDGQQLDDIDNLNPNDIASIEVLKDGASAAIYGSKSANGVIIITTKSGKSGDFKFDIDYGRVYSQLASSIPLANTRQRFFYENVRSGLPPELQLADSTSILYQISNDMHALLTKTGVRDQINISLSGGGAKSRFYWNTGYLNEDGIVLKSSYNRINTKLKLDLEITKRLSGSTSLNLSYELGRGLNEGFVFQQMAERIPYFPVFEPDGSLTPEIAGRRNPVAQALFSVRDTRNYRVQSFNFLEFEIAPSLTFKSTIGVNFRFEKYNEFDPSIVQTVVNGVLRPATGRENGDLSYDILQENYFRFRKKINKHTIGALAGYSTQFWNNEFYQIRATEFVSDNISTFNNVQLFNLGDTRTDKNGHSLTGLFGDVSYDFGGRYLLKGTIRRDGSSRFGVNKRYGIFPSGSIGWRVSGENFFKNVRFVNNLMLKATFGETGNERIGNYESLLLYRPGSIYNGVNGIAAFQLSNPNLGWESTFSTNYGVSATLFKSRLNVEVDFWNKITRNLLYDVPLPEETGFSQVRQNIGSVGNNGIDINLSGSVYKSKSFEWFSSFNFTYQKNKVLELADEDGFMSGNFFIQEGQPLGNFFGYRNLGIFPTDQHNAFDPNGTQLTPIFENGTFVKYQLNGTDYTGTIRRKAIGSVVLRGGDINWNDLDNNLQINGFDREILGNGLAKYFGGFFNEFKYNEFSFSFLFDYVFGNQIFRNYDQQRNDLNAANETPAPERIENAWLKPGDIAEYASLDRNRTQNRLGPNSQYINKGDFIKLRNLRFSYRLPNKLLKKASWIKTASVNLSVNNVITMTSYPGYNPELGTRGNTLQIGQDNLRYPNKRDFIIGIKMGF
ncbi:MAG: TonB-dependent receptor [Spirosomaceae bacterium]|nr:TonB-dependent receptor [Spirosomataceae bacterium]